MLKNWTTNVKSAIKWLKWGFVWKLQMCVPYFSSENEVISKYGHDHHHVRQEMSNQIFKWSIKNHEIKKIIMLVGAGATNMWKMLFWRKNKRPKFWSWDYVMRSWLPFLCIFCVVEEEGGSHAPNLASSHLPKYLQCHQYIWQRPPSFPFKYAAITYECCCYLSYMRWVGIILIMP